ncbi:MAG: hypothetical protein O2884_12655 [Chloroflexi bacterium]|nr:hypothetical protein [Chloroflexota bacterium]
MGFSSSVADTESNTRADCESIPLRLPDGVAAWADAIVEVGESTDSAGMRTQAGLVVSEDGAVLTVFRLPPRPDGIQVTLGGRPVPATVEAFEPLTGATLLRVEATGLTVAPLDAWNVGSPSERALAIWPEHATGHLVVERMLATRDELSPEDMFALLVDSEARSPAMGAVIVAVNGEPIGLAGSASLWGGTGFSPRGPLLFVRVLAGVELEAGLRLLDGERPEVARVPGAVAYHGQSWVKFVDNPQTREAVSGSVTEELSGLRPAATLDGLGGASPVHGWPGKWHCA